jgi:ArsR family transcriptional regulator
LPLRDSECDFACINMVLHHLSQPISALKEIWRIIKPDGFLFITDFCRHNLESMRTDYGDMWLGFDTQMFADSLIQAGFKIKEHTQQPVAKGLALHLALAQKTI